MSVSRSLQPGFIKATFLGCHIFKDLTVIVHDDDIQVCFFIIFNWRQLCLFPR